MAADPRWKLREGMGTDDRLRLLEVDADRAEAADAALNKKLDRLLWAMAGVFLTTGTSAVMLAVNLIADR